MLRFRVPRRTANAPWFPNDPGLNHTYTFGVRVFLTDWTWMEIKCTNTKSCSLRFSIISIYLRIVLVRRAPLLQHIDASNTNLQMLYQDACSVVGLLLARGELRFPTTGFGQVLRCTKYKVEFPPCHLATWQHGRKLYALFWPGRWKSKRGCLAQDTGWRDNACANADGSEYGANAVLHILHRFRGQREHLSSIVGTACFFLMLVSYGQSPTYVQDARLLRPCGVHLPCNPSFERLRMEGTERIQTISDSLRLHTTWIFW